jgi:hypothetical protein
MVLLRKTQSDLSGSKRLMAETLPILNAIESLKQFAEP